MKWFKWLKARRLPRFSLATLTLSVLLLGAIAALWPKWPAWKFVQSWKIKGFPHFDDYSFSLLSQEEYQHYLFRLANLEPGKPEDLVPKAPFRLLPGEVVSTWKKGERIFARTPQKNLHIYDFSHKDPIQTFPGIILQADWFRDGTSHPLVWFERMDSSGLTRTLTLADAETGAIQAYLDLPYHQQSLIYCFEANGRRLALVQDNTPGTFEVWDFETRQTLRKPEQLSATHPYMAYPNTTFFRVSQCPPAVLVSVVDANKIERSCVWNVVDGTACEWKEGSIFYSTQEMPTLILEQTLNDAYSHEVVDRLTLKTIRKLDVDTSSKAHFHFSDDGTRVAGSCMTRTYMTRTYIWDTETGALLFETPENHSFSFFAPDGHDFFTYSRLHDCYWHNQHSERWWGILTVPEFHVALLVLVVLAWSVRRDYRSARP